jgi:hypothetical protein
VELTAGTRDSIAEFRYDWGQGIALSFVQAITNRFSLGASWQYIPAYAIGFVSLGSRYKYPFKILLSELSDLSSERMVTYTRCKDP